MNKEPTITIAGTYGDKDITRCSYIGEWTAHAREFYRLAGFRNTDQQAIVAGILDQIETMAGQEFDRILIAQTSGPVEFLQEVK